MSKSARKLSTSAPADYLELVRRLPLRPLRTESEYDAAWKAAEPLVGRDDLSPGQEMYLDAVSYFLEQYEQANHAIERPRALSPAQMLKELMEFRELSVSDLGEVLGSQPMASMILHGKRGISKANIAKLAAYFRVEPSVFIEPRAHRRPAPSYRRAAG